MGVKGWGQGAAPLAGGFEKYGVIYTDCNYQATDLTDCKIGSLIDNRLCLRSVLPAVARGLHFLGFF